MTNPNPKLGPLGQAIFDCNAPLVRRLLEDGADPDEAGPAFNDGGTVLHLALLYDKKSSSLSKILIEKKANLNALDKNGRPPLICAVHLCNYDAVASLVEAGAALDIKDNEGHTALEWAKFGNRTKAFEILTLAHARQEKLAKEKAVRDAEQIMRDAKQKRLADLHDTASTRQDILKNRRPKVILKP